VLKKEDMDNINSNNINYNKVSDNSSISNLTAGTDGGTATGTKTTALTAAALVEAQSQISSSNVNPQVQKQPQQELLGKSVQNSTTGPAVVKSSTGYIVAADPSTMTAGAAAAKISSDSMKPPPPPSPPQSLSAGVPISSSTVASTSSWNLSSVTSGSTLTQSSSSTAVNNNSSNDISNSSHTDAAAAAVANLNSIATAATKKIKAENNDAEMRGLKRKANGSFADDDSDGYNSEEDTATASTTTLCKEQGKVDGSSVCSSKGVDKGDDATGGRNKKGGKKIKLDDDKREERNAREKERSFRISRQINDLRNLLSSGGVIVPKGTKSSVLTEAANYIRMLQQHQYRSEIDRHQLVQQVQRIGSGALGQEAASAVRHVAAQNGVWSLGNFGGVPPKSAMMYHQAGGPIADEMPSSTDPAATKGSTLPNKIEESDYRYVFSSCTIGMAIATMGGAFIDCNKLFCQISNYTKQEICSMTVFNLTARQDLQSAFDLISQMLSAPLDPTVTDTPCVLRGALKNRTDLGLNVKLIKGGDGVAKCFCVTLIINPASPYDTSKPFPATHENGIANTGQIIPGAKDSSQAGLPPSPAYMTG